MKRATFLGSLVVACAVGGAGMWSWQHYRTETPQALATANMLPGGNQLAKTDPLMNDPVKEMERMHRQMEKFLYRDDFFGPSGFFGNVGTWFNTGQAGFGTRIQESEDDHSVFYTVKVGDKDASKVNVKVENGYVSINAKITDKTANAYAQSSISQSFPVPAGVDPDSAKVNQKGDSVVISFDKVS